MKRNLYVFFVLILPLILIIGCNKNQSNHQTEPELSDSLSVRLTNSADIARQDQLVEIPLSNIKAQYKNFNENAFAVYDDGVEVPSQTVDTNSDGKADEIAFVIDFQPKQTKVIKILYSTTGSIAHNYKKRTQANLAVKENYKLVNGYYTGGYFKFVTSAKVPKSHFVHDALYKVEGPSWGSNKVAYRFYLDERNRNDIFGKKVDTLVMQDVGLHDLVSNSKESYTKMTNWGMDIFKVGESLGIGSIAMLSNNQVETISKTDSVICHVADNGPILSGIYTQYYGWNVNGKKYNLNSFLSISAGSRLTKTLINVTGNPAYRTGRPENLSTGLAKHEHCQFIKSNDRDKNGWGYIATYGEQSLAGPKDKLGIVVFYKNSDLIKLTDDKLSYIVVLRPQDGSLKYYFADAWDQEKNGIKNIAEFVNYLNNVVQRLDNPINIQML